jgi:hypothetical protein
VLPDGTGSVVPEWSNRASSTWTATLPIVLASPAHHPPILPPPELPELLLLLPLQPDEVPPVPAAKTLCTSMPIFSMAGLVCGFDRVFVLRGHLATTPGGAAA